MDQGPIDLIWFRFHFVTSLLLGNARAAVRDLRPFASGSTGVLRQCRGRAGPGAAVRVYQS
jgi:hypothetical protein